MLLRLMLLNTESKISESDASKADDTDKTANTDETAAINEDRATENKATENKTTENKTTENKAAEGESAKKDSKVDDTAVTTPIATDVVKNPDVSSSENQPKSSTLAVSNENLENAGVEANKPKKKVEKINRCSASRRRLLYASSRFSSYCSSN